MFKFFLFLCLYIPFQLALNPTEGVDLASGRVLIIVFFLIWLAEGLRKRKIIINNNIQTGLVITFLLLNVLSITVAQNTEWSIRKLLFLFSFFPIYFVASTMVSEPEKAKKTIKYLVMGGFIAAIIGIIQFLLQFIWGLEKTYQFWAKYIIIPFLGKSFSEAVISNPSWLVNISGQNFLRATSVFPDPHMLSFYLGITSALCFGLILSIKRNKFWWMILITMLTTDFLTFSRGGYLGIFCAGLTLLIIFWPKANQKFKKIFITATLIFVILLATPNPVSQRFFSSFDLREGSNMGRIETWKQALEVSKNNFWLGVGIGNYPLEIKPTADYREPIYAHNAYLDIAAETGLLNALIWLGIIITVGISFFRKSKKDFIFVGGFLALVIFSIHSLAETAIYSSAVLPLFLIIISLSNKIPSVATDRTKINEKNI